MTSINVRDLGISYIASDIKALHKDFESNMMEQQGNSIIFTLFTGFVIALELSVFIGLAAVIVPILGFTWIFISYLEGENIFGKSILRSIEDKEKKYQERLYFLIVEQGADADSILIEKRTTEGSRVVVARLVTATFGDNKKYMEVTDVKNGINIKFVES